MVSKEKEKEFNDFCCFAYGLAHNKIRSWPRNDDSILLINIDSRSKSHLFAVNIVYSVGKLMEKTTHFDLPFFKRLALKLRLRWFGIKFKGERSIRNGHFTPFYIDEFANDLNKELVRRKATFHLGDIYDEFYKI